MLIASAMVAVAVALGAVSAHDNFTAVVAATLWAFATGMMVSLGNRAGDLGAVTLVTLIVFAARSLTPVEALEAAVLAFAGGILQLLLSIALWPVSPYQPERRIIASVYAALAHIAVSPAGGSSAPPAAGQMSDAREATSVLSQDHSADGERLSFLLNQAERIRLSLLALRRLRQRIGRDPMGAETADAIDGFLELASTILESVGECVTRGHGVPRLAGLHEAVQPFRTTWPAGDELSAMTADAKRQVERLAGQLRAASGLSVASSAAPKSASGADKSHRLSHLTRLYANLSLQSTAFRHAVRLAVCVGIGDALGRTFSLQRGYWLPMTVAIVLKPDFTATFSRGILRIAGTLAGLLLATGLFYVLHSGPRTDIALVTVFALVLRYAGPANYGIFVTGISGIAVLLIAITGVNPNGPMLARAVNTSLGGILALAAYWLWPTWERTQTGPVLAKMLNAYRDYFHAVMAAHSGGSAAPLDAARLAARLARSNAEASVERFGAEPGVGEQENELLNAILVSSHTFVRAAMALESDVYRSHTDRSHTNGRSSPPAGENMALKEFCGKTEATLAALAGALEHGTPLISELPDLRDAWQAMNDKPGYTFLDVETDRLTTSVNTLREQVVKWSER
jgi:uncharacterized membrane protein YccC